MMPGDRIIWIEVEDAIFGVLDLLKEAATSGCAAPPTKVIELWARVEKMLDDLRDL